MSTEHLESVMSDPNADFKRAYAELSQSLGRKPTVAEVMPLMETLRQAWIQRPAREETGTPAPQARIPRDDAREKSQAAREGEPARAVAPVPVSPDRGLANPTADETAREAGSAGQAINAPPGPADWVTVDNSTQRIPSPLVSKVWVIT